MTSLRSSCAGGLARRLCPRDDPVCINDRQYIRLIEWYLVVETWSSGTQYAQIVSDGHTEFWAFVSLRPSV